MAVTTNTIRTSSWDVLYTYLQTTNPLSTNNIFSAWNSRLVKDNGGYPIVILHSPTVSFTKVSLGGDIISSEVALFIEVYHNNAQEAKSMTDNVTAKLLAGRLTFSNNRLKNMDIDSGSEDNWAEGSKKVHRISFNVTFRYLDDTRTP